MRAVFDNPDGRLITGQFARIRLGQAKAQDRMTISERAVGTAQDKNSSSSSPDNTVSYRQVELGAAVDGQRIVETGLEAGDRIVVSGLQRIRPGAVVAPQEQTALKTDQPGGERKALISSSERFATTQHLYRNSPLP